MERERGEEEGEEGREDEEGGLIGDDRPLPPRRLRRLFLLLFVAIVSRRSGGDCGVKEEVREGRVIFFCRLLLTTENEVDGKRGAFFSSSIATVTIPPFAFSASNAL